MTSARKFHRIDGTFRMRNGRLQSPVVAYETWGQECLQRVDGDFALVIWDVRRQEAWCARDRLGNKPFNSYWDGQTLVFASELHAILALAWVPQVLNEDMLELALLILLDLLNEDEDATTT